MAEQPTRRIGPLAETVNEIDLREVPRTVCPVPIPVRIVVRPSFVPTTLAIRDISTKGLCLLATGPTAPLPQGTSLALFWKYGPPERWRTIRLDVIWQTARLDGGWIAGCRFAERLADADVAAFLQAREALVN
jgi:hypothetical protein